MQDSCIFCQIIDKEISAEKLFEDEKLLVIKDKFPQAPFHALIIPKIHIATINDIPDAQIDLFADIAQTAKHIAKEYSLAQRGYRIVMNCNEDGGQTVYHIHMHLLGGAPLGFFGQRKESIL